MYLFQTITHLNKETNELSNMNINSLKNQLENETLHYKEDVMHISQQRLNGLNVTISMFSSI